MHRRIGLIVDSAGSIPRDLIQKHNISEIPFYINFGDEQYKENITINSQEFYERMVREPNNIPKTSVPGVMEWYKSFEKKYKEGCHKLIVTTIAKPLSSSIQSATLAAKEFMSSYPDAKIQIFDSNTCACGQAALEIKIAQLIEQGNLSFEEMVERLKDLIPKIISLFSVNELTYMRAGGRIGGATAFLGKLINIKPICEFTNGIVHPIKAVRSRNKALWSLVDEAVKRVTDPKKAVICVQHGLCQEDADSIVLQLRERLNYYGPIYQSSVGAVVGAHSGPGAIGIGIAQD